MRLNYETCMNFWELSKKEKIEEIIEENPNKVKDFEVTSFILDLSNLNTHIIRFKDREGKSLVVCGDFRNYDGIYNKDKLNKALSIISKADIFVVEGKYFGKSGLEYCSGKEIFDKLKNIMKFYKQVFVIQSETDLLMTSNIYLAAMKTKKVFVESTLVCNLATNSNGSCPNPFSAKKVYSYNPLILENRDFEFKKKYVTPFYINSIINKMKKEKYVMNITKDMLQDIGVFYKSRNFYDACVIMAEWKGFINQDSELEEFINVLKEYDIEYYELYNYGQVNMRLIKEMINRFNPKYVIPLNVGNEKNIQRQLDNFIILGENRSIEI